METKSNVARNKMLRNNILFSGVLKAISLYTSFLIVPITLNYLDNEPYGIWMTITSMAFWVAVFDIGLGNGMRNYLTAAISKGDFRAAGIYISSTFLLLSGIALVLAIFSIPLLYSLDIASILNTSSLSNQSLRLVFLVALMLILVNFVLKNIGFKEDTDDSSLMTLKFLDKEFFINLERRHMDCKIITCTPAGDEERHVFQYVSAHPFYVHNLVLALKLCGILVEN